MTGRIDEIARGAAVGGASFAFQQDRRLRQLGPMRRKAALNAPAATLDS